MSRRAFRSAQPLFRSAHVARSRRLSLLLAPMLFLIGSSGASAASVSAPMTVSVRVIARAVLSVESSPGQVVVTPDDVARGYVDLSTAIQLRVRTNSRSGYLLQVAKSDPAFASLELSFGDATMSVVDHESWLQRAYVAGGERLLIQARLRLAPGTLPGTYALPVAFSASPL